MVWETGNLNPQALHNLEYAEEKQKGLGDIEPSQGSPDIASWRKGLPGKDLTVKLSREQKGV